MATDYTAHYHLDKYVATDKPNLRDQYNSAMDKTDDALYTANTNATDAKAMANAASQAVSGKASQADLDALASLLPDTYFTNVNTVKAVIDNLRTTLSNRGRVVLALGDSYAGGWDPILQTPHDGWASQLSQILATRGITLKSYYGGGYGLYGTDWTNGIANLISGMTATEKLQCDTVLIVGGYNDRAQSQETVTSTLQTIVNTVKNNLPYAKIILSFVGSCITGLTGYGHEGSTSVSVLQAEKRWKTAAGVCGCGWDVGAVGTINRMEYFTPDYVHPSPAGNAIIARRLANVINCGVGTIEYNQATGIDDVVTFKSGFTKSTTPNTATSILATFDANGAPQTLQFGNFASEFGFTIDTPLTLTNHSYLSPLIFGKLRMAGVTGYNMNIPVTVLLRQSNPIRYTIMSGSLTIDIEGNMGIYFAAINDNKNNFETFDSINRILFKTLLCNYI